MIFRRSNYILEIIVPSLNIMSVIAGNEWRWPFCVTFYIFRLYETIGDVLHIVQNISVEFKDDLHLEL